MTTEILLVLLVLGATIFLFVTELLRVDVIAILVMLVLGWMGLVSPNEAFSGLASNAVVSVIGVMILGYGVDRSGVMNHLVKPLIRLAGRSESRIIALVSSVVGGISAFMQNVGAAALFLPAMLRLSKRTGVPASRLLMPMGFAAILGGTLSMVGSSPLIILNDLMASSGQEKFGLFSVTPLGLALLGAGIAYFALFGRWVLPASAGDAGSGAQGGLVEQWSLPTRLYAVRIPAGSSLIGCSQLELQLRARFHLSLVGLGDAGEMLASPWMHAHFSAGQVMTFLGEEADVQRFCSEYGTEQLAQHEHIDALSDPTRFGFAELVVRARSPYAGQSLMHVLQSRGAHAVPLVVYSKGEMLRAHLLDRTLAEGDAVVLHGRLEDLQGLGRGDAFLLATPLEVEQVDESQGWKALGCFAGAIGLALAGVHLSLALMSGALAMVLLRVIKMDEAYKAVDWRTVFLLAGLIPLGVAMDKTGAAAWVAGQMMLVLEGSSTLVILLAVAVLTTLFSLFMSNVAATVLLVPLVAQIGLSSGVDPRALALLVGVAASNSFLLPTHQVNALLMGPGGYRNADYLKAGGIMTILFIAIAVGFVYAFYL